jgi:hypothetical protein
LFCNSLASEKFNWDDAYVGTNDTVSFHQQTGQIYTNGSAGPKLAGAPLVAGAVVTIGYNSDTKQAYFQIGKSAASLVSWTPSSISKLWIAASARKTGWSYSFFGTKTLVKV